MPREIQIRHWCFTMFGITLGETGTTLYDILKNDPIIKYFVYQEERCPDTGRDHLQGYLYLTEKKRFSYFNGVDGILPEGFMRATHWEKMLSTPAKCVDYCTKEDTRVGQQWRHGDLPVPGPQRRGPAREAPVLREYSAEELGIIPYDQLYLFQRRIVDMVQGPPDDRSIHWYWEADGGKGKTALAKYLLHHHGALYVAGKAADIAQGLVSYAESHQGEAPRIVMVDIPRSNLDFISYGGIEKLKDGLLFTTKYKSQQLQFPHPWLLCFANEPPKYEKLSMDRWKVTELMNMDFQRIAPAAEDEDPTQGYRPQEEDWLDVFNLD